jgi:hypothetical protein
MQMTKPQETKVRRVRELTVYWSPLIGIDAARLRSLLAALDTPAASSAVH